MESRFLLFKASAGSGKTYNLAMQYIAVLVTNGEQGFRHTLAVTFTNKATAEMKDRILKFLYNFWKRKGNPKDFAALQHTLKTDYGTDIPEEDLRERCHRALRNIIHDYSRFYVSTIDAFFQSVLRNMAHELGLNARLQVDLNDKDVISMAVDNLVENLRHDNQDVLPYLRNYIEQQLNEGRSWDVRRELKRIAGLLFQEEYLKRSLDERDKPFDMGSIHHFKQTLENEREALLTPLKQTAEGFEDILRNLGMDYEELFSYSNDIRRYIEKLKGGDVTANFGKRLSDMVDDSQKMLKAPLRKEASLRPIAQELATQLGALNQLHAQTAQGITSLELALTNLTPMGLLGAIDQEVTRLSNERNRFMLARTPIMLKRMIHGEDASFIFERIGTQFHNIMIDEFQDTSRLQWENFRVLLLDNLADGGLSMVVGDIKQSIYRWRNGDWRILHNLEHQGHQGTPLIPRPLKNNYRSLGHIVTFNNLFFPEAAQELDKLGNEGDTKLTDLYHESEQGIIRDKDSGYVRIQLYTPPKGGEEEKLWSEIMMADLCRQVKDLHQRGVAYAQMTILLRKNRYIAPTIAYFAEHLPEVQLVSGEAFLLGTSVAVRMLVSALQVVDDMERDPVALRYLMKHYLRDVLHQTEAVENDFCLTPYTEVLPESFTQQLDQLRTLPLYELCEKLYQILHLEEIAQQDAYLLTFFDELANYLRDNPSDIPTFIQYWEEQMQRIAIPDSEVDGIRIYTIHKAKGLDFHTVLMPFTDWDMEKDRYDSLYWCRPQEPPLNEMGSLPIHFTTKVKESAFAADYAQEHVNRRADELNALYVAFTRPRANLYVWGMSREELTQDNYNITIADLMQRCLPEIKGIVKESEDEDGLLSSYTFGQEPAIPEDNERQQLRQTIPATMCSYPGNLAFRPSTEASEFVATAREDSEGPDEQQLGYIRQGKLLHYIFSKIETDNDVDRITAQFRKQGILKSDKQLQQIRSLVYRGLQNEQVRLWFSGRYQLFNEHSILIPNEDGSLEKRRPDRVMTDDTHIIVVDYKFGKDNKEYIEQVRMYMRTLQQMYPNKEVEGWLWYVYKNKVEKVEIR